MKIEVKRFDGMMPVQGARKLPNNSAVLAKNVELWSEEIEAVSEPSSVTTLSKTGPIRSIYYLEGFFLHWQEDVHVVRNPVYGDTENKRYYTGHYNPKSTNLSLATTGGGLAYPLAYYRLGLPYPDTAPTVGHTGGTGSAETRSYRYTFVTAWGEEGPPSAVGTHTGVDDATQWDISGMDVAPPNNGTISSAAIGSGIVTLTMAASHFLESTEYIVISGTIVGTGDIVADLPGTYAITRTGATTCTIVLNTSGTYTSGGVYDREADIQITDMEKYIYRTDANGVYRYVDSVPIAQTTYTDTVASTAIGPDRLPDNDNIAPPGDLHHLIALPDGFLAGITGNQLCFSEPNQPYAWPLLYRYTMDYDSVALGQWAGNTVIATDGKPYICAGGHPDSKAMTDVDFPHACVASETMVSFETGVAYASNAGLVFIGAGLPKMLTEGIMKREEWQEYNPNSMRGAIYDKRLYLSYLNNDSVYQMIVLDAEDASAVLTENTIESTALHTDIETDTFYYCDDSNAVRSYDTGAGELQSSWKSKTFVLPRPVNMGIAQVRFTTGGTVPQTDIDAQLQAAHDNVTAQIAAGTIVWNGSLCGFPINEFMVNGGPYFDAVKGIAEVDFELTFKLFSRPIDPDNPVHTEVVNSREPFRLPAGFLADEYDFEISSRNCKIHSVVIAETLGELRASDA